MLRLVTLTVSSAAAVGWMRRQRRQDGHDPFRFGNDLVGLGARCRRDISVVGLQPRLVEASEGYRTFRRHQPRFDELGVDGRLQADVSAKRLAPCGEYGGRRMKTRVVGTRSGEPEKPPLERIPGFIQAFSGQGQSPSTVRLWASSPVMAKNLHPVLVDLEPQRRRLVDAVIPPVMRAYDQLHAPAMREARLPGRVLHGILGRSIQFPWRDHEQVDVAVGLVVTTGFRAEQNDSFHRPAAGDGRHDGHDRVVVGLRQRKRRDASHTGSVSGAGASIEMTWRDAA